MSVFANINRLLIKITKEVKMVEKTKHFNERIEQRGLKKEIFDFIYTYGVITEKAGGMFIYIKKNKLPKELKNKPIVDKAKNWVLFQIDNNLITCYARKNVKKYIDRKTKKDWNKHNRNSVDLNLAFN